MKDKRRKRSRYVVGIDLGTTNSALAYIDTRKHPFGGPGSIEPFSIPQLVGEGEVAARHGLPSFLYLSAGLDLPAGSLALPWASDRDYVVGEFARVQGAKVPGRLVASAKSWLCHGGVDRTAPILPWGDVGSVVKRSPVEISSRYLEHMREAWNHSMAEGDVAHNLENQEVVLTVPASFDEVARELTWDAARKAGLEHVTLLEEPQAAFYSWLARHEADWHDVIVPQTVILICDVGGGTTDFTLIVVKEGDPGPVPERVAVGEHLLLGGDNMDLALARLVESRMLGEGGRRLDSLRWHMLTALCRSAKEKILGEGAQGRIPISIPGRGRGVVGGALSASLDLEDVRDTIIKGFFPDAGFDEDPFRKTGLGIQEWGLPFAPDPAIPRHLAAFLRRHVPQPGGDESASLRPDALFLNGGVFASRLIADRMVEVLSRWFSRPQEPPWRPLVLENDRPDLAVALGASYYGMVRRGRGVRIVGGSPRAYYVEVASSAAGGQALEPGHVTAVCVAPRGMEEGEEVEIDSPAFEVLTNRPVAFSLFSSHERSGDVLGQVVTLDRDAVSSLPSLNTLLRFGKKDAVRKIPVNLCVGLTEVGTLEIGCHAVETDHRWRLQFDVRPEKTRQGAETARTEEKKAVSEEALAHAVEALKIAFVSQRDEVTPANLVGELRNRLGRNKERWPLPIMRRLADELLSQADGRYAGPRHEERWLNLVGFCLRPGYGDTGDDYRMRRILKIYSDGVIFPKDPQCVVEWWVLWRRVAGGLNNKQQTALYRDLAAVLLRGGQKGTKSGRVSPQERTEMWRTLANLERLPLEEKEKVGGGLMKQIGSARGEGLSMWVLSRMGARVPLYGPLDAVVPGRIVGRWIEDILEMEWKKPDHTGLCVLQMASFTGDRERDIDPRLRERVAERLKGLEQGDRLLRRLHEIVALSDSEQSFVFGEDLPAGLHLAD